MSQDLEARNKQIVTLYARGLSMDRVAAEMNPAMSGDSVRRVLIAAGVEIRASKRPPTNQREKLVAKSRRPLSNAEAAKREAKYVSARMSGRDSFTVARELGVGESTRDYLEMVYRAQTIGAHNRDNTCPKFARDAEHVAVCLKAGGFVAYTDTGNPKAALAVRLPLIRPDRAGAAT